MSVGQVLHVFGGKGGAGKTTLATAHAVNVSEAQPKDRVLLIAFDGSHGLSDLLKKKLSAKPAKLAAGKGNGGLSVAEVEPEATFKDALTEYRDAFEHVVSKGQYLGDDDLEALFRQSAPGLEELLGFLWVMEQLDDNAFERVVVDAAPTAHLLRLLDLPQQVKRILQIARVGDKSKGKKDEATLSVLEKLAQRVEKLAALLRDPARTAFHVVALAEPVPEAQTRMFFAQLKEKGFPIADILVNQVEDGQGCPACAGRRGLQAPHVRKFQGLDRAVPVQLIARREVAPRGLDQVRKLAKEWAAGKESRALEFSAAEGPPALVRAPSMPPIAAPPLPPTRLIFFVGQGGVGKSSCAAAAAVTLTEKEGPVLLISTDPAHSLSDVLQSRLTDTETQVKGTKGLYARELDIAGWFSSLRKRIKERTEGLFDPMPKADAPSDRDVLKNLLDCAPFRIDELAAMSVLTDALVQERFKRIVVDPSPANESVRILELPEIVRSWLTALLAVLVKHRAKGLGALADEVAAMLKHVKRFEDALASPAEARFVVVTRGEELAAPKTERLVAYLKAKNLAVERVLVNRVLPKSGCERCENRRKLELAAAKTLEKRIALPVTVAPALGRHPAGLRELKAFRTAWYALSATAARTKAA